MQLFFWFLYHIHTIQLHKYIDSMGTSSLTIMLIACNSGAQFCYSHGLPNTAPCMAECSRCVSMNQESSYVSYSVPLK